jgi:hypothetical protein
MTLATAPTATATTTFELPAGIDAAACAASAESGRYSFNHAQVTTCSRGTWITCTDGRMASVVHLDGPTAGPACTHLVPPSILKKATGKDRVVIALSETGSSRTDKRGTMTQPRVDVENFPPIDDVMPSPESLADSVSVTLNPAYLADLAAALGSDSTRPGITLTIPKKPGKPVVVQGQHGFGLLMPAAGAETPIENYAKALHAWRCARTEGGAR